MSTVTAKAEAAELVAREEEIVNEIAELERLREEQRRAKRNPASLQRELDAITLERGQRHDRALRDLEKKAVKLRDARAAAVVAIDTATEALLDVQWARSQFDEARRLGRDLGVEEAPFIGEISVGPPNERRDALNKFRQVLSQGGIP